MIFKMLKRMGKHISDNDIYYFYVGPIVLVCVLLLGTMGYCTYNNLC
jgi:hypothetical protein